MANRVIVNRRANDTNIQKNQIKFVAEPEFQLPSEVCQTRDERDAIKAALEVFIKITETGLKVQDRDSARDDDLLVPAMRVLGRL